MILDDIRRSLDMDKVGSELSDGRHFCAPSWLIDMATAPDPNAVTALGATLLAQVQQQVQAPYQAPTSSTTENQQTSR